MTRGEAINWLINITADIGKSEHSDLWHYEQALSEIREMLESDSCVEGDVIYRQDAIDAVGDVHPLDYNAQAIVARLKALQSAQPEVTDEQAIEHLQDTGWMQNHDREMYESGLKEQLADDSGSYDSLIPCSDTISRQAAIDAVFWDRDAIDAIENLPPAEPEMLSELNANEMLVICDNCGHAIHVKKVEQDA